MADVDASVGVHAGVYSSTAIRSVPGVVSPLGVSSSKSFFMSARDTGRTSPNDWVVWTSTTPDHAGAGYVGAKGSDNTAPLGVMVAGSCVVQSFR